MRRIVGGAPEDRGLRTQIHSHKDTKATKKNEREDFVALCVISVQAPPIAESLSLAPSFPNLGIFGIFGY